MAVNRLFIPQSVLDEWVDEGRAELAGTRLELGDEGSFRLEPALHFLREATGQDPHGLVGRVKAVAAVEALGAEAYMDSVVLEESAYDVSPGYLALSEVVAELPSEAEAEPVTETEDRPPNLGERPSQAAGAHRPSRPDSDELAELLLKHLK